MKKNNVMRVFSLLLALTLISVCAISGTFAKYVTKAEGQDQARVAKWGVVLTVDGDTAFDKQYETDDADAKAAGITYSVKSSNDEDVVAPGTTYGKLSGGVKGTPEVATRYTLTIKDWTDIVLPAAEGYTDYTNYVLGEGYTGTFDLAADYAPIKWDIVAKNGDGEEILSLLGVAAESLGLSKEVLNNHGVYGFSATEAKLVITNLKDQLEDLLNEKIASGKNAKIEVNGDTLSISIDFDPGKKMDYTFELVWKWAYEGPMFSLNGSTIESTTGATAFDAETVDKADTYLGNVVAGVISDNNAKTTIAATVSATATQID